MKIIKRLAESSYCFTEIQFDSFEEYKNEYRNVIKQYKDFAILNEAADKIAGLVKPINNK